MVTEVGAIIAQGADIEETRQPDRVVTRFPVVYGTRRRVLTRERNRMFGRLSESSEYDLRRLNSSQSQRKVREKEKPISSQVCSRASSQIR